MTLFSEWKMERAEAYQILSQFFLNPPDDEALKAIRQDFSLDSKESYMQIEADFKDLFSADGRLQPVESVFCRTYDIEYTDVTSVYAGADLAFDEDYDVVPDHLSIELLFVSYLISNEKTELEITFFDEHIMNWVPMFCDEVVKEAKTLFYREIAGIVKDFLTAEYDEYFK